MGESREERSVEKLWGKSWMYFVRITVGAMWFLAVKGFLLYTDMKVTAALNAKEISDLKDRVTALDSWKVKSLEERIDWMRSRRPQ